MSDPRPMSLAEKLRGEFDASFAAARELARPDQLALLAMRAGTEPVAVRVLETAGLLKARPVVPVPSARAELLGVCGVRGALLPVFSVARLLRAPEEEGPPGWMVLASALDRPIALAFADLDGHLMVGAAELQHAAAGEVALNHISDVVQRGERALPVVSIPSMLRAITRG